jgi:hypothetical protein
VAVNVGVVRADKNCVFGVEAALLRLEHGEWKDVQSGLGVEDWEVAGSLLFTGGWWGGISEWTVGVGPASRSPVSPLVVCGGVFPSPCRGPRIRICFWGWNFAHVMRDLSNLTSRLTTLRNLSLAALKGGLRVAPRRWRDGQSPRNIGVEMYGAQRPPYLTKNKVGLTSMG